MIALLICALICSPSYSATKLVLDNLVPYEQWYGVYSGDTKIGYASEQWRENKANGLHLVSVQTEFKFYSATTEGEATVVHIDTQVTFDMQNDTTLLTKTEVTTNEEGIIDKETGSFIKTLKKTRVTASLRRNGGDEYVVNVAGGDQTTHYTLPYVAIRLDDVFQDRVLAHSNPPQGYETDERAYDVDLNLIQLRKAKIRVVEKSAVHREGKKENHYVFELHDSEGFVITENINDRGQLLRLEFMGIVAQPESKNVATNLSMAVPFFPVQEIKIESSLPPIEEITGLTVMISGPYVNQMIKANPYQQILSSTDKSVLVRTSATPSGQRQGQPGDTTRYLRATYEHPTGSAAVKSINPLAYKTGLSAGEKVHELVNFVDQYLLNDYVFHSSNVSEIIKSKKGDCTEHTQLFVTLARLNGIPARGVYGLMYSFDEAGPRFVGHQWAEVLVDGSWKQVDPAWGEVDINATHIETSLGFKPTQIRVLGVP